jgi:hypothetical protein
VRARMRTLATSPGVAMRILKRFTAKEGKPREAFPNAFFRDA